MGVRILEKGFLTPAVGYESDVCSHEDIVAKYGNKMAIFELGEVQESKDHRIYLEKGKDGKLTDKPRYFQLTLISKNWHMFDLRVKDKEIIDIAKNKGYKAATEEMLGRVWTYTVNEFVPTDQIGRTVGKPHHFVILEAPLTIEQVAAKSKTSPVATPAAAKNPAGKVAGKKSPPKAAKAEVAKATQQRLMLAASPEVVLNNDLPDAADDHATAEGAEPSAASA